MSDLLWLLLWLSSLFTLFFLSGLMTERAKTKVLVTVERLDRNIDSDVGSDFDYVSTSEFESEQEEGGKGKGISI